MLDWGIARLTTDSVETPADPTGVDVAERRDDDRRAARHAGLHGARAGARAGRRSGDPMSTRSARCCSRSSPASRCTRAARRESRARCRRRDSRRTSACPTRTSRPSSIDACMAALAESPDQRPSARVLGDRVQNYLDGDRDVERRRALAVGRARGRTRGIRFPRSRTARHRDALGRSRAGARSILARCRELVASLMVEPTKAMPKELQVELAQTDLDRGRASARRISAGALLSVLAMLVVLPCDRDPQLADVLRSCSAR